MIKSKHQEFLNIKNKEYKNFIKINFILNKIKLKLIKNKISYFDLEKIL